MAIPRFTVIITAGGIGKRMGENLPKQFLSLNEKPILLHTLEKFYHYDPSIQLILTLPSDWKSYWQELLTTLNSNIPHLIIDGGKERYHSIKNALEHCEGDFVAVHDGVRPLVSHETIKRCFNAVQHFGQVIPVIPLKESLRKIDSEPSHAVARSSYRLVQTPQCFSKEVIVKAYSLPFHDSITDDASLIEEAGYHIHCVDGNEENIKITSQMDLSLARSLTS
jgi:2-C-methyl-D-erythritol 4-phosphate cytidylyltransferase